MQHCGLCGMYHLFNVERSLLSCLAGEWLRDKPCSITKHVLLRKDGKNQRVQHLCVCFPEKVLGCGAVLSAEDCQPISVPGQTVDHAGSFVYLESLLSPDARFSAEIDQRLASASRALRQEGSPSR